MLNNLDSYTGLISSIKILQCLRFIETSHIHHPTVSSTKESIAKLRDTLLNTITLNRAIRK